VHERVALDADPAGLTGPARSLGAGIRPLSMLRTIPPTVPPTAGVTNGSCVPGISAMRPTLAPSNLVQDLACGRDVFF
jgi:hypothetical protein